MAAVMTATASSKHKVSKRAEHFWSRMGNCYGSRLEDSFGPVPPPEWCAVIDRASPQLLDVVYERLKKQHPQYVPTLAQFEHMFVQSPRPGEQPPTLQERMRSYVYATRQVTPFQRLRFNWLYRGKAWSEEGAEITGVVIPADGETSGHVIWIAELERWEASRAPA